MLFLQGPAEKQLGIVKLDAERSSSITFLFHLRSLSFNKTHTCKKLQRVKVAEHTSRAPVHETLTPSENACSRECSITCRSLKGYSGPHSYPFSLGSHRTACLTCKPDTKSVSRACLPHGPHQNGGLPLTQQLCGFYLLGCVGNTSLVQILPHVGEHSREQNIKKRGSTAQDFLRRCSSKWGSGPQRCVLRGWLTDHTHCAKLAQPTKPFNADSMEVLHSKCKYWYSARYITVILGKADISTT